jgi:hypothetical protein
VAAQIWEVGKVGVVDEGPPAGGVLRRRTFRSNGRKLPPRSHRTCSAAVGSTHRREVRRGRHPSTSRCVSSALVNACRPTFHRAPRITGTSVGRDMSTARHCSRSATSRSSQEPLAGTVTAARACSSTNASRCSRSCTCQYSVDGAASSRRASWRIDRPLTPCSSTSAAAASTTRSRVRAEEGAARVDLSAPDTSTGCDWEIDGGSHVCIAMKR